MSLTEDFKTVEELRRGVDAVLDHVQRTERPVIITAAGKPAVVMLKAADYEYMVHILNLTRLLAQGEADVRAGRTRPVEEFFKELQSEQRRANKVSRGHRPRRRG